MPLVTIQDLMPNAQEIVAPVDWDSQLIWIGGPCLAFQKHICLSEICVFCSKMSIAVYRQQILSQQNYRVAVTCSALISVRGPNSSLPPGNAKLVAKACALYAVLQDNIVKYLRRFGVIWLCAERHVLDSDFRRHCRDCVSDTSSRIIALEGVTRSIVDIARFKAYILRAKARGS